MFASGILLTASAACGSAATTRPQASNATVNAFISAGESAQAKGDTVRAAALYEQAISDDPKSAIALYDLGDLEQVATRDDSRAESNYEKALAIDPRFVDALFNLAILETATHPGVAINDYKEITNLDSTDADAYLNLGYVLRSAGELSAGEQALRRAVALDPSLKNRLGPSTSPK